MIPLTTMTATDSETNPWMASLYAGLFTAAIAVAFTFLFKAEIPILYVLAFLLIGAGPVLGYQMATGKLGGDWKSIVGGILGFILLFLGFILWPILVGALNPKQSIGKLFVGSLIGFILGVIVFLILATVMGQNPSWISTGFTFLWAVWGGAVGATMVAWGNSEAA